MNTFNEKHTTPDGVSEPDTYLDAARKKVSDDSLLSALSLVIRANVEYAKGVTDLISCDLEREDKLDEIRDQLNNLTNRTEQLITSQQELLRAIAAKEIENNHYIDKKFTPLYKGAGLKDDGTDYAPADKWVVKFQEAIQSRLFMIITGAIIFWIGKLLFSGAAEKLSTLAK